MAAGRDRAAAAVWACLLIVPAGVFLTPPYLRGVEAKTLVLVVLGLAALSAALACKTTARRLPAPLAASGFALLLLAAVISAPLARVPEAALRMLPYWCALAALHGAATVVISTPRRLFGFVLAALLAAAVVALAGIHGYVGFRAAVVAGAVAEDARSRFLATPFFAHSYLAAQAVLPALSAAAALVLHARSGWVRLALLPPAAAVIVFLGLSLSRAAFLAAAVSLILVVGLHLAGRLDLGIRHPARRLLKIAALALLPLAAALIMARAGVLGYGARAVTERFTSLLDPELALFNYSRVLVWQDTLRMIGDHLPLGIGAGNFGFELGRYHTGPRPLSHAHDQFLHALAELGPLGLLGLLLALMQPLRVALHALRRCPEGSELRAAHLSVLGGMTAFCVLCLVESPMQFAASAVMFAVLSGAAVRLGRDCAPELVTVWPAAGLAPRALRRGTLAAGALVLLVASPAIWRHARAGVIGYTAEQAYHRGALEDAARHARAALAIDPCHPEVLHRLGDALRLGKDFAGAEAAYARHQALVPGLSDVLWYRAVCLVRLGRLDEAVEPLLLARSRAGGDTAQIVSVYLADTLFEARRLEEARLVYLRLVRDNWHAREPVVLRRLAETLLNLGRDRRTAVDLLTLYAANVPAAEARYARDLLADIDRFYPDQPAHANTGAAAGDGPR